MKEWKDKENTTETENKMIKDAGKMDDEAFSGDFYRPRNDRVCFLPPVRVANCV